MMKIKRYVAAAAIAALSLSLQATAKDKEVVVINTPLEVTGEVTGTVSGAVDATVTNTVDVNVTNAAVPVDVVNMVDIQSMPPVQVAPSQVISAGPPLAPGPVTALGLTCVAPANQNGISCEYTNPAREGVIVTHISMSPLVSTLGTSGTACRANASVGGALLDHSWAADQPAGTHIVLPFSVQIAAPRVPRVFVSKTGDVTKSCAVGVVFHGYRLP